MYFDIIVGTIFLVAAVVLSAVLSRDKLKPLTVMMWGTCCAMLIAGIACVHMSGYGVPSKADDMLSEGAVYQIKNSYADAQGKIAVLQTPSGEFLLVRCDKSQGDLVDGKLYVCVAVDQDRGHADILRPYEPKG